MGVDAIQMNELSFWLPSLIGFPSIPELIFTPDSLSRGPPIVQCLRCLEPPVTKKVPSVENWRAVTDNGDAAARVFISNDLFFQSQRHMFPSWGAPRDTKCFPVHEPRNNYYFEVECKLQVMDIVSTNTYQINIRFWKFQNSSHIVHLYTIQRIKHVQMNGEFKNILLPWAQHWKFHTKKTTAMRQPCE